MSVKTTTPAMPYRRILHTWWPLAASWLLMAAELPALSAVIARLANPEINLAAYGGVVFPLSLIVESPIIMLLAASTALSKDWDSYQKIRKFMLTAGAILTGLHLAIAFTPLYYVVVKEILGVPVEIVEPARVGLQIMTPWTWSIAYRRFNQGVLIRFDHSKAVSVGTMVRLSADLLVLAIGYSIGTIPGIIVATSAVACGVISEAVYVGFATRPVINRELKPAPAVQEPLSLRSFLEFYIPLAMTSFLLLFVQPIGSAAMSRMPEALASLAIWPVISGSIFLLRSMGMAYNEVVVALLDEPGSTPSLRRFSWILTAFVTVLLLIVAATPLSRLWFGTVQGLNSTLEEIALLGLWIALPIPGLNVLQSWYQGAIVNGKRTRGVTEAVVIFLFVMSVMLVGGARWGQMTGLYVTLAAFSTAMLAQTIWLWFRSRKTLLAAQARDEAHWSINTSKAPAD